MNVSDNNILVTAVGGDIGQNVVKCLHESGHLWCINGCDMDQYAGGRKLVVNFTQVPKASSKDYLSRILNIVNEYQINYIIPISEAEISIFNKNRELFKNVSLVMNNAFIIDTFMDKYKTILFLAGNNLPYPMTYHIRDFKGQLKFPVIMKGIHSYGAHGRALAENQGNFDYYKKIMPDCIVQECIGDVDHEYTVGVFSDGKQYHSISFRRYLGYGSLSKYVEIVQDEELKSIAETIAQKSNLVGSLNVQFRKTDKGFIPFEVNPRISSSCYFRHHYGFEDVKWWLYSMMGRDFSYSPKITSGIGVRTVGEVFYDVE